MASELTSNGRYSVEDAQREVIRLLLDALPSAAVLVDVAGRIAALNQQAESFLGWTASGLAGQTAHETFQCRLEDGDDAPGNCPVERILAGEAVLAPSRMSLRCRGDLRKPVEYRCVPYPTGRGMGAVLAFNDITRQLEVEKDLRSLAFIAEASPTAIVELNEDANLIHANPAMMSLIDQFGFNDDVRPVVLPANIGHLTAECLRRSGNVARMEVQGRDHYFEWKFVPVFGERMVRGYGVDVTSRKRVENELARAKRAAEAANAVKSDFLANVAREMRTSVSGIVGMVELLGESDLDQKQRAYAQTIQTCSKSLLLVIDKILETAELDPGKGVAANSPGRRAAEI